MHLQNLKKKLVAATCLLGTAMLLCLSQTEYASAAKTLDTSNLNIQESAVSGSICSNAGESGVTGCDISYSKLVTITFKSLDSSGNSNAQPAIQAALDYARNARQDGTIYKVVIPSGSYRLDWHLFIYDNTWLSLQPDTRLIKNFNKSCMI